MSTYYEILNVSKLASSDDIKQAYHKLAKIYHPDLKTGDAEKFKLINEAYAVLYNGLSRKEYDKQLNQSNTSSNNFSHTYTQDFNYDTKVVDDLIKNQEKLVEAINTITELVNKMAEVNNTSSQNNNQIDYSELTMDSLDYLSLDQLRDYEADYRKRASKIISSMSRKEKKQYQLQIEDVNNTIAQIQQKIKNKQVQQESEWYYSDPTKESIFTILFHFNSYRFENAISALWKRWAISMFGASIVYIIALPFILLTKILFFFRPSKERQCPIHWLGHVHNLMYRNHFITSIFWSVFLTVLGTIRLIWTTLFVIYWLFKNIIRFLLLPFAILAGSIILGCGRLFFFPKRV